MGTWLLFFAYLVSVVGCVVGLACTLQARKVDGGTPRIGWLAAAAVSIGGVGIWLMHFIAMLGFDTPGMPVRYDIGRTAISAALSIAAVFLGLVVFGVRDRYSPRRLLVGGLITGLAVNLMHYTGMWAVEVQGTITYNPGLVWLSIVIAIVAATAALWFTVLFDSIMLRLVAGLIMGIAVTGMHYTGMAAVRVNMDTNAPAPEGVEVFTFLFPVFVLAVIALAIPIYAVLMASTWSEADEVDEEPVTPVPPRRAEHRYSRQTTGAGVRGVQELVNRHAEQERQRAVEQPANGQHNVGRHGASQYSASQYSANQYSAGQQQPLPVRRPSRR